MKTIHYTALATCILAIVLSSQLVQMQTKQLDAARQLIDAMTRVPIRVITVTQRIERVEVQKQPEFKPGSYDEFGWHPLPNYQGRINTNYVVMTNGIIIDSTLSRISYLFTNVPRMLPNPAEQAVIDEELNQWERK